MTGVLAGVGVYLVAMLVIGVWAARRADNADDFIVAGRRLGLWVSTATVSATWMGSGTIIGAAGTAYGGGFLAVIGDPFGAALGLLIAALFFARTVRRMGVLTMTDILEIRFGPVAGMGCSLGLVIVYVGWTAAQLVAFGFILETLLGIDTTTGIVVGAAIVLIYTAAGGMWAVALTDFAQMIVLLSGLVVLFCAVLWNNGGWAPLASRLPPGSFRMIPDESTAAAWFDYLRAWTVLGFGGVATQDVVQRMLAARDERVAQNSFYLSALVYLSLGLIPVMLGLFGSVLIPGLENPEFVIPRLATDFLPPTLQSLFVGALLAAIMSSADSALLAQASLLSTNIAPWVRADLSSRGRLAWARYSVPVAGTAAVVVAIYFQTVYSLVLDSFSVVLVALSVPFTAAIWWPGANRSGVMAGMVTGVIVWVTMVAGGSSWPGDFVGFVACLVTTIVVTLLSRRADPPRPLTDRDGNLLELSNRLGLS